MPSVFRFIPFVASNGTEYELKLELEARQLPRISQIDRFVEDDRGVIRTEPRSDAWDGLMEMTHALRVTIVSWSTDSTN